MQGGLLLVGDAKISGTVITGEELEGMLREAENRGRVEALQEARRIIRDLPILSVSSLPEGGAGGDQKPLQPAVDPSHTGFAAPRRGQQEGAEEAAQKAVDGRDPKGKNDQAKAEEEKIRLDRGSKYGHVMWNMESAGLIIQGILENHWQHPCPPIPARVVALINVGIKLSRAAHQGPHEPDTIKDAIIYLHIHDELDGRIP